MNYRVFALVFDVVTVSLAIGLLSLADAAWWAFAVLWAYGFLQWCEGYLRKTVEMSA